MVTPGGIKKERPVKETFICWQCSGTFYSKVKFKWRKQSDNYTIVAQLHRTMSKKEQKQ